MWLSRVGGILLALVLVAICVLLAESGGAPSLIFLSSNMCAQSGCHSTFPLNQRQDLLSVSGFPERYIPGNSYDVAVVVRNNPNTSAALARGGFAAFVNSDGSLSRPSVGVLVATDPGTHLRIQSQITYVTHSSPRAGSPEATFGFRWTAPAAGAGGVVLVVAANSANGNGRETEDFISRRTFAAEEGQCSFAVSPTSFSFSASGGSGAITVSAPTGCNWTAASNADFITITSGAAGSGNGNAVFSVAAHSAAAARSGTLTVAQQTVTVDQAGTPAENEKLYFAQFGDGPGISSTFILMNPSVTDSLRGTVRLFDAEGQAISVDINGNIVAGSFSFEIPPEGVRFFATDAEGPLVSGSVQISSTLPVSGTILFSGSFGVTAVPGIQPLTRFLIPIETDSSKQVDTGVAVANPSGAPVEVRLLLRDTEGKAILNGEATVTLAGNGQLARFPSQIFAAKGLDLDRFKGTLEITSSVPLAGMAIRVSPGHFSTLPVAGLR
ncbi:MAG: hypothetical protein HY645_07945 [Acidobacteria bacterium]|nr:hypothetical protein [Acidobacteriota bacterium]